MHERREPQEEQRARPGIDRADRAAAVKISIALLLLIVFVLFIIRNSNEVPVDFVFFDVSVRLVWVFLACAVIGALIAWLLGRPRRRAQRRLIEELERSRKDHD